MELMNDSPCLHSFVSSCVVPKARPHKDLEDTLGCRSRVFPPLAAARGHDDMMMMVKKTGGVAFGGLQKCAREDEDATVEKKKKKKENHPPPPHDRDRVHAVTVGSHLSPFYSLLSLQFLFC
eukprot:scaffold1475_cov167-Amphora_coffeaeformis.AAC.3